MRLPAWLHLPDQIHLPKHLRLPKSWQGRALLGTASAVVVVVLGVGLAYLLSRPHNVSNPKVAFTVTKAKAPKKVAVDTFLWPFYGYTADRTHAFDGDPDLHPPFRVGWRFRHNALLEFPPTIYGHRLFFMDDGATAKAVNTENGHQLWLTRLGTLSAATPALDVKLHRLFVPTLSAHGTAPGDGDFYALSMKTGRILWKRPLASGSESSPVVVGDDVYFGDQAGTVYALNARTGHVVWSMQTAGAVKGGPAYSDGVLYFANYAGAVYAVNAKTGHQVWEASAGGGLFGSATFYATPTVAFGRVYIGNTNGFVYSYSAKSGQLAWSIGTGAYVYSAAAVQNTPGLGPTVYVGSYNGEMYALNARSGATEWSYNSHSAISGAASIINNVVYFSGVYDHVTTAVSAITGKPIFHFPDGAYTSVIASPKAIYLSGHYVLYELLPKHHPAVNPTGGRPAGTTTTGSSS